MTERRRAASIPNILSEGDVEPRRVRTRDDDARRSRMFPAGRALEDRVEDVEYAIVDLSGEALVNVEWRRQTDAEIAAVKRRQENESVEREHRDEAMRRWAEGLAKGVRADMAAVPAATKAELAPTDHERRMKRLKVLGVSLAVVAFAAVEAWKMLGGAK